MTINEQTMTSHWNEIKGKLRERWGALTDDELEQAHGNWEQLIGMIQRRTGESAEKVREYLEGLSEAAGTFMEQASASVRQYSRAALDKAGETAKQVTDSVRGATQQAMKQAQTGYHQTEAVIHERPWESIAVCFGVGLITGVVLGLTLRGR
jgi:uncharacterized protein YjbJ (UPF0337 family)